MPQPDPIDVDVLVPPPVRAVEVVVRGPQGPIGPQGPEGPQGAPGLSGVGLQIAYPTPLAVWEVAHGLGRFPSVMILDTANEQLLADVAFIDADHIRISFSAPTAGVVSLN